MPGVLKNDLCRMSKRSFFSDPKLALDPKISLNVVKQGVSVQHFAKVETVQLVFSLMQ